MKPWRDPKIHSVFFIVCLFLMMGDTCLLWAGKTKTNFTKKTPSKKAENSNPSKIYQDAYHSYIQENFAKSHALSKKYLQIKDAPNQGDMRYLEAMSLLRMGLKEEAGHKMRLLEKEYVEKGTP